MPNSGLPSLILAMAVFCSAGYIAAATPPIPTNRPSPRFVAGPLPREFRVAPRHGEHWLPSLYGMGSIGRLIGRDRLVATIYHYSDTYNEPGDPAEYARRLKFLGWVTIATNGHAPTYLSLDHPESDGAVRIIPGRQLFPWSPNTCALQIRLIPREAKEAPDHTLPGEQTEFWEWDPLQRSPKRLGRCVPVEGLAKALWGTGCQVDWSDQDAEPWLGNVRLVRNATGQTTPFRMTHLVPPADNAAPQRMSNQQFGPADDDRSIIVLERTVNRVTGVDVDFALWRLDVHKNKILWRLNRDSLEKAVGGPIAKMHLIDGPARPCASLPILILLRGEKPSSKILWTLETQTGSLDGPYYLPWTEQDGGMALDYPDIVATGDGRVVANRYQPGSTRDAAARLVLYDLSTKTVKSDREIDDLSPITFLPGHRLVTGDAYHLRCLSPPYDVSRELFRLEDRTTESNSRPNPGTR